MRWKNQCWRKNTAGGAGIELAYKLAEENFYQGGNNRVILATDDGDFNVGASSNTDMQTLIEEKRKSGGSFLNLFGLWNGQLQRQQNGNLADKGNGNYAYIDIQEANRFLGKEFKGSMFAIAKDVKIKSNSIKTCSGVPINWLRNRKLRPEDFTNDTIDAGELGSHTVTALYEVIPTGLENKFINNQPDLKYTKVYQTKVIIVKACNHKIPI
jgi:Ca-activated chloride channel family protein